MNESRLERIKKRFVNAIEYQQISKKKGEVKKYKVPCKRTEEKNLINGKKVL